MKLDNKNNPYEDIINLPRHISNSRIPMSQRDRAAQFAPFSAVVGYDKAVKEAARHTENRRELDESQKEELDNKLRDIEFNIKKDYYIRITYFQADASKLGGTYITIIGVVEKINRYTKELYMKDSNVIKIQDIYSIIDN